MNDYLNVFSSLLGVDASEILIIEKSSQGLSQTCWFIETFNEQFVIKSFNNRNSLDKEKAVFQSLSDQNFIPKLLKQQQSYLLMPRVGEKTLADAPFNKEVKISIIAKLAAQFHFSWQDKVIPAVIKPLSLLSLVHGLVKEARFSASNENHLFQQVHQLVNHVEKLQSGAFNPVVCHGDLNLANVLISEKQQWLIDFESVSFMPIEYDLAMLLAVNEYSIDNMDNVVNAYQQAVGPAGNNIILNKELIWFYYQLTLLINGCWYLAEHKTTPNVLLFNRAMSQFKAFCLCDEKRHHDYVVKNLIPSTHLSMSLTHFC